MVIRKRKAKRPEQFKLPQLNWPPIILCFCIFLGSSLVIVNPENASLDSFLQFLREVALIAGGALTPSTLQPRDLYRSKSEEEDYIDTDNC